VATPAQTHIAKCTEVYARALLDPFGYWSDVCIPDLDCRPSAKYRCVARATAYVGAAHFGYVTISPFRTQFNDTAAEACGFASLANYPNTTIDTDPTHTGVTAITMTNAPFSASNPTGNLKCCRLAACGVRVRYTGTQLNMGGRVITSFLPGVSDSSQGLGTTTTLNYRLATTSQVGRQWHTLVWYPREFWDYGYVNTFNNDGRVNGFNMIIILEGEIGNSFEVEVVSYVEYGGTIVNLTPSHADEPGLSMLKNVSVEADPTNKGGPTAFKFVMNKMLEYGPTMMTYVGAPAAMSAASYRMGGRRMARSLQLEL